MNMSRNNKNIIEEWLDEVTNDDEENAAIVNEQNLVEGKQLYFYN